MKLSTDPNIIRYFMLIPEACQLVLEAGARGKGGYIYVFDMGKPVKIVNLARKMIELSGAKNIDIKFTGLRAGEKLYEEPLSTKESCWKKSSADCCLTLCGQILRIMTEQPSAQCVKILFTTI